MFCEEPIIKVWYMKEREINEEHWDFPVYTFRAGYYVTEGYWLVFQTEHHYISLGADGVRMYDSRKEAEKPDLEMQEDAEWGFPGDLTVETLVFSGEHIRSVTRTDSGWEVEFDHLKYQVVPCTGDDYPWDADIRYIPYQGVSHHLKKCECGGEAELMVDHVGDHFIRCSRCHRSTDSSYILSHIVADWNEGNCPVKDYDTPLESFAAHWDQPVRKIVISRESSDLDTDHYSCDSLILQYDGIAYILYSLRVPPDRCVIAAKKISGYNPEFWPKEMEAGKDEVFLVSGFVRDCDREKVMLSAGRREIMITADVHGLMVDIRNTGEKV